MAVKPSVNGTKVITGKVRLSYCNLFTPRVNAEDPSAKPKYGCTILVPKTDTETVAAIRSAIETAKANGKDKTFGGKIPAKLKLTFRDADAPDEADMLEKNPSYAGHYFMAISTTTKPGVVDSNAQAVMDESEVYSGCYARVSMNAGAYSARGNQGITFYLNNVQKLADGEALGASAPRAEDEFSAVEADMADLI